MCTARTVGTDDCGSEAVRCRIERWVDDPGPPNKLLELDSQARRSSRHRTWRHLVTPTNCVRNAVHETRSPSGDVGAYNNPREKAGSTNQPELTCRAGVSLQLSERLVEKVESRQLGVERPVLCESRKIRAVVGGNFCRTVRLIARDTSGVLIAANAHRYDTPMRVIAVAARGVVSMDEESSDARKGLKKAEL